MDIYVVTLFPEMFEGPFGASIIGRAVDQGLVRIQLRQLRDHAHDKHLTVDEPPFGGGPGMVLKAEPLFEAVESICEEHDGPKPRVVLMSPQGRRMRHQDVARLAGESALTIVCGHYEGVDERFIEHAVDEELSIGDYVLTGGEIPAMALVDAMVRLLPGALGDEESAERDTFAPGNEGLLQGPIYTRPAEVRGWRVPEVLLSGDHRKIAEWRRKKALEWTRERRPDLLKGWPDGR